MLFKKSSTVSLNGHVHIPTYVRMRVVVFYTRCVQKITVILKFPELHMFDFCFGSRRGLVGSVLAY